MLLRSLLMLHDRMAEHLPVPIAALDCLILGCAIDGDVDRAFHAFAQAESLYDTKPQLSTFQALLIACTHAPATTFLPAINAVFREMQSQSVTPTAQTYHIAVGTLLNAKQDSAKLKVQFLSEVSCPLASSLSVGLLLVVLTLSPSFCPVSRRCALWSK